MAAHRRVEPRTGLAGTGMATDVDRLRQLEDENQRRERAWRDAPAKGFGAVLEEAPPRAELEEDEHPDPRRRPKRPPQAPGEVEMAAAATSEPASTQAPPNTPAEGATKGAAKPGAAGGPRRPPDPRAAALHQQLARAAGATNKRPASHQTGSEASGAANGRKKPGP